MVITGAPSCMHGHATICWHCSLGIWVYWTLAIVLVSEYNVLQGDTLFLLLLEFLYKSRLIASSRFVRRYVVPIIINSKVGMILMFQKGFSLLCQINHGAIRSIEVSGVSDNLFVAVLMRSIINLFKIKEARYNSSDWKVLHLIQSTTRMMCLSTGATCCIWRRNHQDKRG